MLKKIYRELVLIRKELQAIQSSLESERFIPEDSNGKHFENKRKCCKPI